MTWAALVGSLSALLAQAPPSSDSLLRVVERRGPDAVALTRQTPDTARATLTSLFVLAVAAPTSAAGAARRADARFLALAYAAAWRDSFLVRQVARFERWGGPERVVKVRVDSLRRAGGEALGRSGTVVAMRLWQESLRLARAIDDSAGMAAALGNLGAGAYRDGALDQAARDLARSRALAVRLGDHRTAGNALGTLASVAKDRGEPMRARALYVRALAERARTGDDRGAAADENNLGLVAESLGDTSAARRAYEAALGRNRRAGRLAVAAHNLTNLANLATLQGGYATAASLYREALRALRAAGEQVHVATVLHDLGLLEARRGDYVAAARALDEAIRTSERSGPTSALVATLTSRAAVRGAAGDLQSALHDLRRAESLAARDSTPGLVGLIGLARADLAVAFNAMVDAQRGFEIAAAQFALAGDDAARADAQEGLGLVLLARDRPRGARDVFELVLRQRVASGDRHAGALARRLLGHSLAALGDTLAARRRFREALAGYRVLSDAVGEAGTLGALGDIELAAGRPAAAVSVYQLALARLGARDVPAVAAELHAGLARARAARGARDESTVELRRAVDAIERVVGGLRLADYRAGFRADKWDLYAALALAEFARGDAGAAFEVSERLRARQMLDLLAEGRVTGSARPRDSLIAAEQDLRSRVAELTRTVEDGRDGALHARGVAVRREATAVTRADLDAARRAYAQQLLRVREGAAEFAEVVRPTPASAAAVAARLDPDEALLEYLVSDSTTVVFVIRTNRVTAVDLRVGRRALAAAVDFTRETLRRGAQAEGDAPWRSPLTRLHRILIDPVERAGMLRGVRTLLVAPHAELHFLPFAALIASDGSGRFLVERFDLAQVPSASVWMSLAARHGGTQAAGVLAFAPRMDALPASRREVEALRSIFGGAATVLTAGDATESAFRARGPDYAIIHFATFGVLNKHNPLFSHVELARDALDDGQLAVHEIFSVSLRARLVVLSACQTALGAGERADVPAGDDWIGLVRGFLYAGADNVLATLWPVEDAAAASVMVGFYRELVPGRSLASALARAQRRALRDGRTANPVAWAAFTLVGAAR